MKRDKRRGWWTRFCDWLIEEDMVIAPSQICRPLVVTCLHCGRKIKERR